MSASLFVAPRIGRKWALEGDHLGTLDLRDLSHRLFWQLFHMTIVTRPYVAHPNFL